MRKYSERFINNTNILKHAIVGFEFELYMKDLSYYKTLELLNQYLAPVKVWGFRQYHSDFKPDSKNFKLEPDLSLGSNGCEIITGPMDYFTAKHYLVKLLKFIQEHAYTTSKSAIHFNISFSDSCDKDLNDLNLLKLILKVDEDEIYRAFPERKGNVYAKSIKKIIPYKEYDYNNIPIDVIKNSLRFPSDKYYGINFLHINSDKEHQRLEYRYIGGKDYHSNIGRIMYFLDKFIIDTYNSVDVGFEDSDIVKLEDYLQKNISLFKTFSKYDNFIVEFPNIVLQIDQNNVYDVVNAYYPKLYSKIFNLLDATNDLKDCIINYVTATQKMEIINANIKSNMNIKGFDFINCQIFDGIFDNCFFVNSQITNSQLLRSDIHGSDVKNSKVLNSNVESSTLKSCFFMGGYLNSYMDGGVFRSGKLGPYAEMSSETRVVSETENFFDTTFDDDDQRKDKMGVKSFKK